MALNYSLTFNVYEEDGSTKIPDVKIHTYFYKVNDSSSDSTWDSSIKITNGIGQVSTNLGNSSYLTSDGKIDNGDIVLVSAWLTDNTDQTDDKSSVTSGKISRCVNFIHTVDTSASSWTENFVLPVVLQPSCNIDFPTSTLTGHSFTLNNTSTVNEGPFAYNAGDVNRNDLYQNFTKYGQDLFIGRKIKETFYDLVETSDTLSGITNFTYSWVDSGVYDCTVRVYNSLGYYCESTNSYTIRYNKPNIDFDFTFAKLLNTDKHIGVGNDDLLSTQNLSTTNFGDSWTQLSATFEWTISDSTQTGDDNSDNYVDKDVTFEPTKYFLSEGTKDITLLLNWNDGFADKTETLVLHPILDIYNIDLFFHWETEKNYKVDGIWIPLGDDDLTSVYNEDVDSATQNYDSLTQWKSIVWTVTKKKNDNTDDTEVFSYNSTDNNINDIPQFYVKWYHNSTDLANVKQDLVYWDGYKDVNKTLDKDMETQKYLITHDFHWDTDLYGLNKVVTRDDDSVTITNDSIFSPQNNQDIVTKDEYNITKEKYTSYTDETVIDDSETFIYTNGNLVNQPNFNIGKEGNYNIQNIIYYYDGYANVTSELNKTIQARVSTPNIKFQWITRHGLNTFVEGRDDTTTFSQKSTLSDYYETEYPEDNDRNLGIDWFINNYIKAGNYNDSTVIGGTVYDADDENIETFLYQDLTFTPKINFWTALESQDVSITFYYNDGYFDRDSSLTKQIETRVYTDLIPDATFTSTVPSRKANIDFIDNSTNNEERIISEDWSLTDRYESNSMSYSLQGEDNLQTWKDVLRTTTTTTKVNSQENHTLSQDEIRWDDGFHLKLFNNSYIIETTKYSINPDFAYSQIFVTGPEIRFDNITTVNGLAEQLSYELLLTDEDNDGTDTTTEYLDLTVDQTQDHTYKSVSNSPFDEDLYNKPVTITVWFDDGWNEVWDSYSDSILVKPNRITQDFLTNPIRHPNDTETSEFIITGNNPIEFHDNSTTLRKDINGDLDYGFVKEVNYTITDTCN